MNNIIELQRVCKGYGKGKNRVEILQSLDFSLKQGEFAAIIGKSGSGKTTLLNILGILDGFDSGKYIFKGREIQTLSEKEKNRFRNQEIGFVFQFHYLLKELTVYENIVMPAFLKEGKISKEAREYASELLTEIELMERKDYKVENLSGGEKQRVAIARALINRPALILADEPTGNLDVETSEKIHALFSNLVRKKNQSVLVVTHSVELAALTDTQYKVVNNKLTKNQK
ncbi:MAG: ABC transporter ATP-binding protein [Fusobacteria bacterium]|nr:ABC transporter ATP-binding protein [Fusobacteriota bacterium]